MQELKGVIGRDWEDEHPVIYRFVNEPPSHEKMASLPWLTVIAWKYEGSETNGMPPAQVNERMVILEEVLRSAVEKSGFCEHAISRTGNNLKEFVYYIHDRDAFLTKLNDALQSLERFPIEITFYEDVEWKEFERIRTLFNRSAGA